ncbi:hypothetical protein DDV96_04045 [Marixanthomonas spongiae]|uniref:Uncharacterized protein n=1 Tax=Marixanthomonas spongiae TaxID=2174845 RepID=A0A2U0I5Q3_9FLAO|nr:hypothetical protein DDV96_04045 [Marixanthomonas spongiae]
MIVFYFILPALSPYIPQRGTLVLAFNCRWFWYNPESLRFRDHLSENWQAGSTTWDIAFF